RETFAASVVLAADAITVAAPIAEGGDEAGDFFVVRRDGAAFTHSNMVRGIERHGRQVSKSAGELAAVTGAEGVAIIFNDPKIVFTSKLHDDVEVEGNAERVRHHNAAGFGADGVGDAF